VLKVADVNQLVLQFRYRIPVEAAVAPAKIQGIDRSIYHPIADPPILKDLILWLGEWDEGKGAGRIRFSRKAILVLIVTLMSGPRSK
jgi:hypothetical protein